MPKLKFRLRDINRWHVIGAFFLAIIVAILLMFQITRLCSTSLTYPARYCSISQTLAWISNGGNWALWI